MEEQLQAKLVEILSSIQNAAKASGDFVMEQLPDIAQQYILYGQVMSIIYVFVAALLLLLGLWAAQRAINYSRTEREPDPAAAVFGRFGSFVLCPIGVALLVDNIGRAVLVWTAPKVWLLIELGKLWK